MDWNNYPIFSILIICCWLSPLLPFVKNKWGIVCMFGTGILLEALFIGHLWYFQGYPPLRSENDTKLWYSFILACVGLGIYLRWGYKWLLCCIGVLACIFVIIILCKHEKEVVSLPLVLQSVWFVPHVLSYMLSYSFLLLMVIVKCVSHYRQKKRKENERLEQITYKLLYSGIIFLIVGLLVGMQWANNAWGAYWSWDLKEIWALITLLTFLLALCLQQGGKNSPYFLSVSILGVIFFMITWLGLGYLPCSESLHLYSH